MIASTAHFKIKREKDKGLNLSLDLLKRWLLLYRGLIHENVLLLTDLDAAIGDADHGINMQRGVDRVGRDLESCSCTDVSALFRLVSVGFTSSIGGASGPLYGAFFLHAASVAPGKKELSHADFALCLQAGLQGVVGLGRAGLGDKTMVDVLIPAVAAYRDSLRTKGSREDLARKSAQAALIAATATIPMQARKGRASYLGARSIGHQDPGATSTFLLFQALSEAVHTFQKASKEKNPSLAPPRRRRH